MLGPLIRLPMAESLLHPSPSQKKLFLLFLASCKSRSYLLNELKFPGPLERCLLYCKFCVSICKFV